MSSKVVRYEGEFFRFGNVFGNDVSEADRVDFAVGFEQF